MDSNYLYKRLRATEALTADLLMLIGRSMPFLAEEASAIASKWRDTVQELEHKEAPAAEPARRTPPAISIDNLTTGRSRIAPVGETARTDSGNPAGSQLDANVLQAMTQSGLESLSELAASGNLRAGALVDSLISDIRNSQGITENIRQPTTSSFDRAGLEEVIAVSIRDSYAFRAPQAEDLDQSILRKGPIEVIEDTPSDFVKLGHGTVSIFLNLRENQFIYTPSTGSFYNRSTSNNWKSVDVHDKFDINAFVLKAELDKLSKLN